MGKIAMLAAVHAGLDDDPNEDACKQCGLGGELICCDGCPAVYHLKCLGLSDVPEGSWHCPACVRAAKPSSKPSASGSAPAVQDASNDYERLRAERIAKNKQMLASLVTPKVQNVVKQLGAKVTKRPVVARPGAITTAKRRRGVPAKRHGTRQQSKQIRTSNRLKGAQPEFVSGIEGENERVVESYEESGYGYGRLVLDEDVVNKEKDSAKKIKQLLEHRCNSKGRGSIYDSKVGITCHFCRQKKLCAEEDCPRCSTRSVTKECIGKSDCSRCHSATGMFCRACLLIRYGLELEDVREKMAKGEWLCPHCYEEDHPNEGWICNSSICMTRRGMAPTGIAIYEAQGKGFPSVAHFVQAKLLKTLKTMRAK